VWETNVSYDQAAPDDHRCRAPDQGDKIIVGRFGWRIAVRVRGWSRHSTPRRGKQVWTHKHPPGARRTRRGNLEDTTGTCAHGRRRRLGDRH